MFVSIQVLCCDFRGFSSMAWKADFMPQSFSDWQCWQQLPAFCRNASNLLRVMVVCLWLRPKPKSCWGPVIIVFYFFGYEYITNTIPFYQASQDALVFKTEDFLIVKSGKSSIYPIMKQLRLTWFHFVYWCIWLVAYVKTMHTHTQAYTHDTYRERKMR